MTASEFETTVELLVNRAPFRPFMIELNTGDRLEIDHRMAVAITEGLAIFIAPGPHAVYFTHDTVTQIVDAPAHAARSRKPRK